VPITPDEIVTRLREMAADLHTTDIPQAVCD